MDINRTNESGPSRQPTNEGDEQANPNPSIPIVAVQQAAAEEVATNPPPGPIRESVIRRVARVNPMAHTARVSVIRRHVLVPEAPANPNQAPQQNPGVFFRPWMAADPTRAPQASAESDPNPTSHSDEQAGPSALQPPHVAFEQPIPSQSAARPIFDPNAAGPSHRIPEYALAGPSSEPKPYAPTWLMLGRLSSNAYPPMVRLRALQLSSTLNASQIARQLKLEFPARSPSQPLISLWIRQHKEEIARAREAAREVAGEEDTTDSDSD